MNPTAITIEELLPGRLPGVEVRRVRGDLSVLQKPGSRLAYSPSVSTAGSAPVEWSP